MSSLQIAAALLGVLLSEACTRAASSSDTPVPHVDLRVDGTELAADVDRVERVTLLESGHLAYTEPYRRRIVFLDLSRGSAVSFGRDGRGPGEFSTSPKPALRLRGDTVGVLSQTGKQLHLFSAAGGFVHSMQTPIRMMPNEFDCETDSIATIYCRVEGTTAASDSILRASSSDNEVPVVRFRVGDTSADTVWALPGRGYRAYTSSTGNILIRPELLYPPSGFGVTLDGSVWRILGKGLRVDIRHPSGSVHEGPVWNIPPQRVSTAERDSILKAAQSGRFGAFPLSVHETKPVFRSAIVSPFGSAWVRLASHGRDVRYRVFDNSGFPVADVDFLEGDSPVGFTSLTVIVLRESGSGEYSLRQIDLPSKLAVVARE